MHDENVSDVDRQAMLTAVTTDHFVMQTAISASVSEQQARASMYLYSLSGALVAIGFMAQSASLMPFVAAVLSVIFVIGLLTTLRLIDIAMENLTFHIGVAEARAFYRGLGGEEPDRFGRDRGRWPEVRMEPSLFNGPTLGVLTTAASMIAIVNAIVAGVGAALLATRVGELAFATSVAIGAGCGLVLVAAFYRYQLTRLKAMVALAVERGVRTT